VDANIDKLLKEGFKVAMVGLGDANKKAWQHNLVSTQPNKE
jgi:hypothetical protein